MEVISTSLEDVKLLKPKVFGDARGFFLESYNQKVFEEALGINPVFVQDNHSRSSKGVLRGLHYQMVNPQGKLLRVTKGEIFDVAVDMRKNSPQFGAWAGFILSEENKLQAYIPPGFAHGFLVLSEIADVLYKTTSFYHPASDRSLLWCDKTVGIKWPLEGEPILSEKDKVGKTFEMADYF